MKIGLTILLLTLFNLISSLAQIDFLDAPQGETEENSLQNSDELSVDFNNNLHQNSNAKLILTLSEIESIEEHKEKYGPIRHPNELQIVIKDTSRLREILPHLINTHKKVQGKSSGVIDIRFIYNSRDQNSEDKIYAASTKRLRYLHVLSNGLKLGFIGESDAGETAKIDLTKMFLHLPCGGRSHLVLGHFDLNFGEGFFSTSPTLSRNSSQIFSLKNDLSKVKGSSSFNEFTPFGLIWKRDSEKLSLITALSLRTLDATEVDPGIVSSINFSGYHQAEVQRKNKLREIVTRAHGSIQLHKLFLGFSVVFTNYSKPIIPETLLHNIGRNGGSKFLEFGTNFSYPLRSGLLFGSAKFSQNIKPNFNLGLLRSIGRNADLGLYTASYTNGHLYWNSFALGSSSQNKNEHTQLIRLRIRPNPSTRLGLSFENNGKRTFSYGNGLRIVSRNRLHINYVKSRRDNYALASSLSISVNNRMALIPNRILWNMRYTKEWKILRLRARTSTEIRDGKLGSLLDFEWKLQIRKWQLYLGHYVPVIKSPNVYYFWENDLLHTFNSSRIWGSGQRNYQMIIWKPNANLEIRCKYWRERKVNLGRNMEIDAQFGLKLQSRFRF